MNTLDHDFFCFGMPEPEFIEFIQKRLHGENGLAIENDHKRIQIAGKQEIEFINSNFTQLTYKDKCVRFVTLNHVLQRLDSFHEICQVIKSAARLATDFLFIQGPYYDADAYLESLGLKFFYSDWNSVSWHLTTDDLQKALAELGLRNYEIVVVCPTLNSRDPFLHPLESPPNQQKYHVELHPPKPEIELPAPVYKGFVCYVKLREIDYWDTLLTAKEKVISLPKPERRAAAANTKGDRKKREHLDELRNQLLLGRKWAWLRYMHLRNAFLRCENIRNVLAIGAGNGYAELALAVEFPDVHFHLSDITPYYKKARKLSKKMHLYNVSYGARDILEPAQDTYDFVESIEVLEHIEDDTLAAQNILACANRYLFTLVPFADDESNQDQNELKHQWELHKHFRVGYSEANLRKFFPNIVRIQGCYWKDGGALWRTRVNQLSDEEILANRDDLMKMAEIDCRPAIPQHRREASGIWAIAKA